MSALLPQFLLHLCEQADASDDPAMGNVFDVLFERALADESELPLALTATITMPGSKARILVMQQRYLRGEQVFHPSDLRWEQMDHVGRRINRKKKKNAALEQEELVFLRKG